MPAVRTPKLSNLVRSREPGSVSAKLARRHASALTCTERVRGPSSSQKKMPCHVPSASSPSSRERDQHLRPHQGRADVRRGVLLALLDVLPAPAFGGDLLQRHLEVAGDQRIGVLVDRQPRRRVRARRRARAEPVRPADGRPHLGRDVEQLGVPLRLDRQRPHGVRILGAMSDRWTLDPRDRRAPRPRRPVHRRPRRGVLPPLRGTEGQPRRRAGLRALRGADEARDGEGDARVRRPSCGASPARAILGNLTRAAPGARSRSDEAALEATVDGEHDPVPDAARRRCRTSPTATSGSALEETRLRLLDEHLNPVYLEAAEIDRDAVRQLGAPELLRALQELRLPPRRARRRVPRRSSTRPRSSGSARATGSSARGSASACRTPGRGMCRASSARPSSISSIRRTACCRRSSRRSATSASTCTRRATSTSTSRAGRRSRRARSARRSRCLVA